MRNDEEATPMEDRQAFDSTAAFRTLANRAREERAQKEAAANDPTYYPTNRAARRRAEKLNRKSAK